MAMKKLYKKKGQVHPSLPSIADYLGLLPVAISTLTASLSPEDKEVLAYLISCSGNFSGSKKDIEKGRRGGDSSGKDDHLPVFDCDCFRCYMSFWARWDASTNRYLIHEIIEAYEEDLVRKKMRNSKGKKGRRKKMLLSELEEGEEEANLDMGSGKGLEKEEKVAEMVGLEAGDGDGEGDGDDGEVGIEKGSSMRRFVNFLGERFWGVWNMG
ncbi:hypothetical protein FEM48_Zijuj04G0126800 [Ziziphus jujuba var. spinosa]|uniref:Uncharacterized protein n=1 Tax=Ziziphus jujuba var. spinosa TaxID=714518 RepID=A0A978VJY1_ZIZJJ|nr:hypothetical protein FEM48_Zijuj04G0126800 [Ziziphus jujuba var. spinosa]